MAWDHKLNLFPQVPTPPPTDTPSTPVDVHVITSALSAAMLTKSPPSRTNMFMKNKGRGDDVKPLKEAKQWNAWHRTFLSVAHSHDFIDITDLTYVPDPSDDDACSLFDAQQKHAFGILVGSPQVPFLMCTAEIPQKLQHKFFALNFGYLYF